MCCWVGTEAPARAQWISQADGLRQRQPKSAAEDEGFANMQTIMAFCTAPQWCAGPLTRVDCPISTWNS